jgi:hypothetical protein
MTSGAADDESCHRDRSAGAGLSSEMTTGISCAAVGQRDQDAQAEGGGGEGAKNRMPPCPVA